MRCCALLAAFVVASLANAEDGPAVRRLDLKDVKLKQEGKAPQVSEIASAEALAKCKLFADDASRDAVKKLVDFTKEKLVVSAWSGSKGDRFTREIERGEVLTVNFVYQAGEVAGAVPHGAVFVVPKTAKVVSIVQEE